MPLNKQRKNEVGKVHASINGLEVQKGMKDAVASIEKNIFELFTGTPIEVSDKKSIEKLENGLFLRIDELRKTTKKLSSGSTIDGIKATDINASITKLDVQKNTLANIRHSIEQINSPKTIKPATIFKDQDNAKILASDIVSDTNNVDIGIAKNTFFTTNNGEKVSVDVNEVKDNSGLRQIVHKDSIIGRIKKGDNGWEFLTNPNTNKSNVSSIILPFEIQKEILIPSPHSHSIHTNFVRKTKNWKINIDQDPSITPTPESTTTTTPTTPESTTTTTPTTPESTTTTTPTPESTTTTTPTPESTTTTTPTPESTTTTTPTPESTTTTIPTPESTTTTTPTPESRVTPKQLELPPHMPENPIDTIDQKMEQLLNLVNMADMRMQYTNLKTRWDTLKMHMQNFDRNQNINADTPLFRSIFPALEHEVNEFKKQLTNAIIDTQDKIELIKNSGIADLAKVKQLEQEIADIKAKYNAIQHDFDSVQRELFERIYKKTPKELPPHIETDGLPTNGTPTDEEPTNNGPAEKLEISAHVMDKESLVKKSIEQDVLEEYQHKYEKRRWPKRLAMYTFARWRQDNRINNRLSLSKKHNEAIETDITRQQRIASSIGNFASEYDLGLDAGKVKKTSLGSNDAVNTIANNYIKGTNNGGISRQDAITQFNDFFTNNKDYQTGMTGSDIMEQLDDVAFMIAINADVKKNGQRTPDNYKNIQDKISEFFGNHPTAQLHGVHFNNPNVASKEEINKLCDHIIAYKSKTAVTQLNNITANVKLYKVEKDTVELTQSKLREHNKNWIDKVFTAANLATFGLAGSTMGNAALKVGAGVGLAAGGVGALGVVGGVAGVAAVLQWMKTYRDYLTEAQKTHEDAITMGTKELDRRIKELEEQIKKHGAMKKTLAWRGFGKHAIRTKQLNILKAVNDKMYKTGAIKPAIQLITEMQDANKDKQALAIAETLARLKAGRELDTNFISGTNRALTEQERKSLLIQLREAAAQRATKVGYGHLVPPRNANEEKWRMFWDRLIAIPQNNIGSLYQKKYAELKKNFQGMKDDISTGRKKMARRDAGSNLLTSATVAGVAAGVSAGAHALQGGSGGVDASTINGPHNEYALGQYETAATDKASGRDAAFNNGDKVSFQGEAAVDAVNASTGTFGSLSKEITDVNALASAFDTTTQDAVKNALTTELAKVKAEAIASGADAGNVILTQQRWVDGVEEILTKLQVAGKTGVTIEDIIFDASTFNPIDIQASAAAGSGVGMQDVIDRSVAFQATIDGTTGTWNPNFPLWVVRPGFSNTYAKPGDESKHDDSWSKRTQDLAKKDKEEAKKKKEEDQERDDYNKDFDKKYGLPGEEPTYTPVPPVVDKDEDRKKKWKDNKDKPFEPNDGGEQPQNHPYGDPDSKRGVSPRGREGSRNKTDVPRFFEKDYPKTPMILDPKQAAERIIAAKYYNRPLSDMPFIGDPKYAMGEYTIKIEDALRQRDYQKAVDLLAENISKEQEYVDEQSQELGFNTMIDTSLTAVDEVFDELGVLDNDRSELPDKDHIHIIPSYLFHAQSGEYSEKTLGFIQFMNGHVFINYEALKHGPNGDRSPEEQKAVLVHAITHEVIHGATTTNYHKTRKEKDGKIQDGTEDYVFLRRMGTQLVRRTDTVGNLKERGRALNEGLTESLNLYILQEKLGMQAAINGYPGERKIVDMLSKKFDLEKTDLYKFLIHRKFGSDIIRKIYGKKESSGNISYERPGYITLLMELMDSEHLKNTDGGLPLAEKFVQEKNLVIKQSDSKKFHPSLINPDGSLKADILSAYPFIRQA